MQHVTLCPASPAHALRLQIASFALAAVFSGFWFVLWARMKRLKLAAAEDRLAWHVRMWPQLGWFSGLVCVGSVVGTVTWGARMILNDFFYAANAAGVTTEQNFALGAAFLRWNAAFYILYPVEFLCLIIPKLMLLRRLTNHANRHLKAQALDASGGRRKGQSVGAIERVQRVMTASVVLCSMACMIVYDVVGAYALQAAALFVQAAAACDAQGSATNASTALGNAGNAIAVTANTAVAVQSILETVVLLIVIIAYVFLVPISIALFRRVEFEASLALLSVRTGATVVDEPGVGAAPHVRDGSAGAAVDLKKEHVQAAVETVAEMTRSAAVDQRRRFLAACLIVLATFAVRAAYNIMSAYSGFNDPYNPACGLCDACQTERFLIFTWMSFTPEFQPIVVALSSPLPLAVSLWLMMSQEERTFLRFPGANDRTYLTPEQKKAAAARARMGVDLL